MENITGKYYLHNNKFCISNRWNEDIFLKDKKSIYEVIRIHKGKPLFVEDHLERLLHSSDLIQMNLTVKTDEIYSRIIRYIGKNKIEEGRVKLIVSSGKNKQQEIIMLGIKTSFPSEELKSKGIRVAICKAIRSNPNAKVLDTPARKIADETINKLGVYEVLLKNSEGKITEGSRSNVFFIKNNELFTAPESEVLEGVTRKKVIHLAKEMRVCLNYQSVDYNGLSTYDAAFITGTTPGILPVNNIEGILFETDNCLLQKMMVAFDDLIEAYIQRQD